MSVLKNESNTVRAIFTFHAYLKFITDQEENPADLSTCAGSQRAHASCKSGKEENGSNIKWIL